MVLQFILTLQTNIRAKVSAIVNINIDKVTAGSVLVTNTATFTDANSDTATAGQSALAEVLQSGDVTGIFGTQYGDVSVSNVMTPYAGNPSKSNACCFFESWCWPQSRQTILHRCCCTVCLCTI